MVYAAKHAASMHDTMTIRSPETNVLDTPIMMCYHQIQNVQIH